jgi:hypothetical protein
VIHYTYPEVTPITCATERALRAPILGRKNHYGSKYERGKKAAAICSSRPASSSASTRATTSARQCTREAVHRAKANPDDAWLPHAMLDDASDLN